MIDPAKKYRTRDGREVRIYAVDGRNGHRVHGAILIPESGWEHRNWLQNGRMYYNPSDCDLIEVRPRIQREVWVNVYPNGINDELYFTKASADQHALPRRIACVKLVIDCEEGHGLD